MPMHPTLLDTKTGKTVVAESWPSSIFWWAEGNGSCDCNRALCFDESVDHELSEMFGENNCYGNTRIIAIDVHGDLEGLSKTQALEELNRGYPESLEQFWKPSQIESAKARE